MRLSRLFALSFAFLSFSLLAQQDAFVYKDRTCKVWVKSKMDDDFKFHKEVIKVIEKKGYVPQVMVEDRRLFEGDIYFTVKKEILKEREVRETTVVDGQQKVTSTRQAKLLYKDCQVNFALKKAKDRIVHENDKVLYTGTSIRSHPRITLKGNERCIRALWDASIDIPPCKN